MGRDPLMIWGARSDTLYGLVTAMDRAADQVLARAPGCRRSISTAPTTRSSPRRRLSAPPRT